MTGGTGIVKAGDVDIIITPPLSQSEESILMRRLRLAAADKAGDNYNRCKAILEAMRDAPGDRLETVREITRATIGNGRTDGKSPLDGVAFIDFRFGPEGLVLELFARGKKATPGLSIEILRACITDANSDDVAEQMLAIIETGDPKSTP